MKIYNIIFSKQADKFFDKQSKDICNRILSKVNKLSTEPHPSGSKKIEGSDDLYRIRVGDYRVIYKVVDNELIVLVLKVGHRQNVYFGF